MKRFKLPLLVAVLSLAASGCISAAQVSTLQSVSNAEAAATAKQVAEHVRFDAYTGRLVVDRGAPPAQSGKGDLKARLEKLEQLKASGVITEAEYTEQRKRLLDSL